MKINNKLIALTVAGASMLVASCDSADRDFPDYEGGVSVYFPYQTPVRTLVLGTDEYDTSLDHAHKCKIGATMGGAYNGRNIVVDIEVDNDLVKGMTNVVAMPTDYYSLSDGQIKFNGEMSGFVEVQLTDKFFADPKSVANNYVIPVVMKSQKGADYILAGEYDKAIYSEVPSRFSDVWSVKPKDYVLYCVKYQNKYTAYYSRCGKYTINGGAEFQKPCAEDFTGVKDADLFDPVIDGDDCQVRTASLTKALYTPGYTGDRAPFNCELELTFADNGTCTVSTSAEGYTVTGTGKFTEQGAKKAWGDKDRDIIEIEFTVVKGTDKLTAKESLVWKRSGVKIETFEAKF